MIGYVMSQTIISIDVSLTFCINVYNDYYEFLIIYFKT